LLLECVAQAAGRDTQVLFVAGSRVNRVLLEVTRISSLVPVFNSVREALAYPQIAAENDACEDLRSCASQSQKLWECVNESDRSQIFKACFLSPCWRAVGDVERDASFGQPSPVQPIQHAPARSRTIRCRITPQPQSAQTPSSQQPAPAPSGAAGAKAANVKGAPVAQPAGAAVAPARQRGHRSLLIKLGVMAGAGIAVGAVVAFVGEKSGAAAQLRASHLQVVHEHSFVVEP
jgi:hypothetical protein